MDSTDISDQIGALELGDHPAGLNDGVDDAVLEAAGADPEVSPSAPQGSCIPTLPPLCR